MSSWDVVEKEEYYLKSNHYRHILNNISGGGNTRRERLMELRRENLLPRGLMEEELSFLNMYKSF